MQKIIHYTMKERVLQSYHHDILSNTELKNFLRITGNHEDLLIENLLKSVIKYAENLMGFELSHKILSLNGTFKGDILLKTPLISVNSVKSEGQNINFMVTKNKIQPVLKIGSEIEIIYEAGFAPDEVPDDIKFAILQHISSIYDIRLSGGKVSHYSLEIYNRYRNINI